MFISKNEKEEYNRQIESLRHHVIDLNMKNCDLAYDIAKLKADNQKLLERIEYMEQLFLKLVEINSEEIHSKVKDVVKTVYSGFKDLFIADDKKVKTKQTKKANEKKNIKKCLTKKK